jgi:hypothetical protein
MFRSQSLYLYISMYDRIAMQILQPLENLFSIFPNYLTKNVMDEFLQR